MVAWQRPSVVGGRLQPYRALELRENYLALAPLRSEYLHHGKTGLTSYQAEPWQGRELREWQSEGGWGKGGRRGLPCALAGRRHYLLLHPRPETPASQICHLLGSKHCASP